MPCWGMVRWAAMEPPHSFWSKAMTLILHLLFIGAAVVYVVGNYLDYHNSLGRGEQNPMFQDARGYFDPKAFKRVQLRDFVIMILVSLAAETMLSFGTPKFAWILIIGIGGFLFVGIRGMILSRR
jgi:hypothetical protein